MNTRHLVLPLICVLSSVLAAQDMPSPAPELQKFKPLIGNWHGTGTAQMGPGEPTKWESHSTYTWALSNFFVQEDTIVRFAGMPKPLVMRSYLGWDAENKRYVAVVADNDGSVNVNRIELQDDGSVVQFANKHQGGATMLERYSYKIEGDSMTFAIDMMGAMGPSAQPVKGKMTRTDKPVPMALDASSFSSTASAPILQLGKTAGTYAVSASLVMMPGSPPMKITGQDEVKALFDGTIVHVHTTGTSDAMPGEYVGELFYGFDERDNCIRAVYISNMGEVGVMNCNFSADNKTFILTSALRQTGQPCVQRTTMDIGADGAITKSIGHTILGTAAPYESWNGTYTKKK